MIRARTPALVAALTLVLSFGSSVAFARSGAQVSLSTAQVSAAPDLGGEEEEEEDPMAEVATCLDSDTLGECVNCCLDAFVDDPSMFYVCVEECSDACEDDDGLEGSEDVCDVSEDNAPSGKTSVAIATGASAIRTLSTTARRAAESDGGVQTADPDDCLDSDTLGECVNCCLDSFVDEPADFQACADECANQCDADAP